MLRVALALLAALAMAGCDSDPLDRFTPNPRHPDRDRSEMQDDGCLVKTDDTREWTQKVPLLKSEHASAPDLSLCYSGTCRKLVQGEQISVRSPMNGQKTVSFDGLPL